MLQVNQVWLQRGRFSLLEDISFEVTGGDRILLTGLPGSGKTQLFRLLTGLAQPTQGSIGFQGKDIATYDPAELRRKLAWVADPPRLLGMSVREAIAYPLQLQSIPQPQIQAHLTRTFEQLGLPEDWLEATLATTAGALSMDQQCCVALARAWVMQPQLLLLEWPADDAPMLQQALIRVQQHQQAKGGALILSSSRLGGTWPWGKQQDWTQILYLGRREQDPEYSKDLEASPRPGASLHAYSLKATPQVWQQVTARQKQEAALLVTQDHDEDWSEDY